MTPLTFNGCFGWLHGDETTGKSDIACLICPGLNHDGLNAHHAHRLLADELAVAGYPTMRFDYPQTGDSADLPGYDPRSEIDLWRIWLDSVDTAIDVLRQRTGAQRVILCGLRIGATIAARVAAGRRDVAGLILIAPVIKGHSYLRQLWIEAQLYDGNLPPLDEGVQFQDICFNRATVRALGGEDLRRLDIMPGVKIAIFSQSHGRLVEDCRLAWEKRGAELFCAGFDGLEPMLSLNVEDDKAHPDFRHVLAWVKSALPADLSGMARGPSTDEAVVKMPGVVETPLRFGDGGRLFGVLCQPEHHVASEVVLVVNAGRDPHPGPGRFNVELARVLARHGIASLRFDFAGLGDSLGPPGEESKMSSLFDLDRTADVSAAIDALLRMGFRNFAAYGLCAGAYHAMVAAVADSRLSKLLLVNMPLLAWSSGESIDFIRHKNMPLSYFLTELAKLRSWSIARHKILKSGSVLRGQILRFSAHLASASWWPVHWLQGSGDAGLTAGQRRIAVLLRRNVKTLLLFGEGDLGLDAVTKELEPLRSAQSFAQDVTIQVLPNFDHLVSHERTRRAAANCMLDFLRPGNTASVRAGAAEMAVAQAVS
jgi:pimeloyl-ACP methyl ester carboxylesterase